MVLPTSINSSNQRDTDSILNNVLTQAAGTKTLAVADVSMVSIKTYPNPFVNSFTLEINSEEAKQSKLTVFNLSGQIMLTDNIRSESGMVKKLYNTEGFAAGLYVVELSNAKGTIAKVYHSQSWTNKAFYGITTLRALGINDISKGPVPMMSPSASMYTSSTDSSTSILTCFEECVSALSRCMNEPLYSFPIYRNTFQLGEIFCNAGVKSYRRQV
jgi:hypothetical protein